MNCKDAAPWYKPFDPNLSHADVVRLHESTEKLHRSQGRRVYCGPLVMQEIQYRMQKLGDCKEKLISVLKELDIKIPQALRDADPNLSLLGHGTNEKGQPPRLLIKYDDDIFQVGAFLLGGYFSAFDEVTYQDYLNYTQAHGNSGLTLPPEVFAENSSNSRGPLHELIKGLYPQHPTNAEKEAKVFEVYNKFLETLKYKQQQAFSF